MHAMKNPRWMNAVGALALLTIVGCRQPIEENFQAAVQLEEKLDGEVTRLESGIRTLRAHWDITALETDAETMRQDFHNYVRERSRLQNLYRSGETTTPKLMGMQATFLKAGEELYDLVSRRRIQVDQMKEMTDQTTLRLNEVGERMRAYEQAIAAIALESRRLVLEAKVMTIQKAISDAQSLLENGMRLVQTDPANADKVFLTGLNELARVDRTIEEFLGDVREELAVQQEGAGSGNG